MAGMRPNVLYRSSIITIQRLLYGRLKAEEEKEEREKNERYETEVGFAQHGKNTFTSAARALYIDRAARVIQR